MNGNDRKGHLGNNKPFSMCEVCLLIRTLVVVGKDFRHLSHCLLTSLSQEAWLRSISSPTTAIFQADWPLQFLVPLLLVMQHELRCASVNLFQFFALGYSASFWGAVSWSSCSHPFSSHQEHPRAMCQVEHCPDTD